MVAAAPARGLADRVAGQRSGIAGGLAVLTFAVALGAVASYSQAAPYVGLVDLARVALPGLLTAGAVAVLALLGRPPLPMVIALAGASVLASGPWLGIGLQQRSPAWVAILALGAGFVPVVVAALLAYPDGVLAGRLARTARRSVLAAALVAIVVAATAYDPGGWGWCRCVGNPLAVLGPASSSTVHDGLAVLDAVVAVAGLGVFLATTPRPPRGVTVGLGVALAALVGAWVVQDAWLAGSRGPAPSGLEWAADAALALALVLYVAGYLDHRPSRAHVADLLLAAREEYAPTRLRQLVARAIGDPRTQVAWWDPATDGFRDHLGAPLGVPVSHVLPVEAGGRPIALVLSDRLPAVEPSVRDAVAEALLLSSENRRLTAELRASLDQVRESRERILTAGDETRRRIERDLHDGAQQLLVSTGIKLNLAAAQAGRSDSHELARVLEEAQAELNRALAELRNLASGIAPTALVHGGLDSALRELAMHSPVPTAVRVTGDRMPDERTAATAYFVVAECLTNAVKHAGASRVVVDVSLGDHVGLTISDDGHGGARLDSTGTGLRGLVDRVEARGGRLTVTSGPGGTTVTAQVPSETERVDP